jgi:hypothetical protein
MTEAFATIIEWCVSQGAVGVDTLPGLWRGSTDEWDVSINGHKHEIDDVPPFHALVVHKTHFARLALIAPNGGQIIGWTEDALIQHFRDRTPRQ